MDIAATGAALEFAKIRATVEVEDRLRGEAIADLLAGSYPTEAAMAARVARLGHDLGQPHDLLVIDVDVDGARADELGRQHLALVREHLGQRAPQLDRVPGRIAGCPGDTAVPRRGRP